MAKTMTWDESFFLNHWKFADKDIVMEKMKGNVNVNDFVIEINKLYPLYKDLFGVKIEFGSIKAVKVLIPEAMDTLTRLIQIRRKSKDELSFEVTNNYDGMLWVAEKYELDKPEFSAIQGYILNNELIEFVSDGYDCIKIKYKDNPENIFYIYKFYFSMIDNELYLIIEKNI